MMRSIATGFFALLMSVLAPQAMAGIAIAPAWLTGSPTNLNQNPLETKDFGSTAVGTAADGALETVTVHVVNDPPGTAAKIDAISATGDFTVTGGTCTTLSNMWADGNTCTLQLRFAPLVAGLRNGLLSISCRTLAAVIGVAGVVCDGGTYSAYNLTGTGIGASAVPALGREGLTLIALALVGTSLFALRRRR
jgi:hypothetical protein